MSFHFHEFRNPRRRRLFIPRSAFSFAAFMVPIKFRQPEPANGFISQPAQQIFRSFSRLNRPQRLDGTAN